MKTKLSNPLRKIRVVGVAAVLCACAVTSSQAGVFQSLDPALFYTVLALDGNVQQSGPTPPAGSNQNNIQGNIGVASAGFKYQGSGSVNDPGEFDIHTGSTFSTSSSGTKGPVMQGSAIDARLENAKAAALNTSSFYAGQTANATYGNLSGNFTISEASAGNYIFNISSINLSGSDTITLSAPAGSSFVLNITGAFSLSGSTHISLAGGLTATNVLYNVLGSGNVAFSGGGNSSGLDGILLAVDRTVMLSPVLINGAVIARDINMASGASVIGVVPEMNAGLIIPGLVGLMVLASSRRFLKRKAADAELS
jgi:choice-of-anchor A domain-containing protein